LHETREDADTLMRQRGFTPWSRNGVYDDDLTATLVAQRQAARNPEARPDLAYALARLFHVQSFGPRALWLREMDGFAAWSEAAAGKPLPSIPQSLEDSFRAPLVRFDE